MNSRSNSIKYDTFAILSKDFAPESKAWRDELTAGVARGGGLMGGGDSKRHTQIYVAVVKACMRIWVYLGVVWMNNCIGDGDVMIAFVCLVYWIPARAREERKL